MLELAYKHPRTGKRTQIRQAVGIARQQPFELKVGAEASVMCWGVMPSGMLRHRCFSVGYNRTGRAPFYERRRNHPEGWCVKGNRSDFARSTSNSGCVCRNSRIATSGPGGLPTPGSVSMTPSCTIR